MDGQKRLSFDRRTPDSGPSPEGRSLSAERTLKTFAADLVEAGYAGGALFRFHRANGRFVQPSNKRWLQTRSKTSEVCPEHLMTRARP